MRTIFCATVLALFAGVGVAAAQRAPSKVDGAAAGNADSRWQPWVGCWQLRGESVGDDSDVSAESITGKPLVTRTANATRVCVAPAGAPAAITLSTVVGSQKALEETIIADGSEHPFQDAECRGTRRSEWSKMAPRLFTRAEITCTDQAPRKVSSLSMLTLGPTWVDIQMIEIGGRKSIRVRRYDRIDPISPASFPGENAWSIDDVKEATTKLAPETVQAALVELRQGFNLNSKRLIELDAAGVPDGVIDLMVALSYPKRFVVEHPVTPTSYYGRYGGPGMSGLMGTWPFIADSLFWYDYYSPFAYRYWGYYDPYYYPYSGYVTVYANPPAIGSGSSAPGPTGEGRVIDGLGYTRVRPRDAEPSIRANNFGGATSSTMSSGSGSSGSSGGGSNVSSGGYSSGGSSGGDGGRTAVPRPPGGN